MITVSIRCVFYILIRSHPILFYGECLVRVNGFSLYTFYLSHLCLLGLSLKAERMKLEGRIYGQTHENARQLIKQFILLK